MTARTNNPDTTATGVRNVDCSCGEMFLCWCLLCMTCETSVEPGCDNGDMHCPDCWHDCWFCCREARLEAQGR